MDRMKKQMQRTRSYLHIDKEGYEVHGDSIEIGLIDWSVTENPEEQVTEIQIL